MSGRYVLTDFQSCLGQEVINTWAYESFDSTATATELAALFQDTRVADLQTIQSDQLTHSSVQVFNLDDLTDFATSIAVNSGTLTGNCMPPFVCYAFRFIRATRETRHGHKRIAGVAETSVLNGVVESSFTTTLQSVGTHFADTLTGESATYIPRIYRRAKLTTGGGGPWAASFHPIVSVETELILSSQNSRKIGRGA